MKGFWFSLLMLFLLCTGCASTAESTIVTVTETAGLNRDVAYVSTVLLLKAPVEKNKMLFATDIDSGNSIAVQVSEITESKAGFEHFILFPIRIEANQIKNFKIHKENGTRDALPVALQMPDDMLSIENNSYKIIFSTNDDPRGGQVAEIVLKQFEDQLLKRGHIAMHWAPNFSKSTSEKYFNLEDLPSNSKNVVAKETYQVLKKRSGVVDSVPEIHSVGNYTFYADVPYFIFESTMTMKSEVTLNLLRNDEMTMDSLFTHVAYSKPNGSVTRLPLYNDSLAILDTNPIADAAEWVAFYNLKKGYGFGSIRLKYDNTNEAGSASPTHKPYTKISKAANNGRYWNRVLSDTIQTFPKGSQYYEKNAYLVFKVNDEFPEKEIVHFNAQFQSPLKVQVSY